MRISMGKVLLISGHGKNYNGTYDPGACSIFGQEADYTRELVSLVYQSLGQAAGVEVYDQGKNCYSYSKAGQAPDYGAYDLVLEIHFNAKAKKDEAGDGRFTGIGAYVHPDNAGGRAIAEKIVDAVVGLGFGKWQIASSTGLLNLNKAQGAGTKYLLLETAFIDDGDDMRWYNTNKTVVAQAIAQVISKEIGSSGTVKLPEPEPSKPVSVPQDSPSGTAKVYVSGMYKVNDKDLNIRSGPGTGNKIVGSITDQGTYTITEMSGSWGRLKSGAGWINCSTKYCTRTRDADSAGAEPEDHTKAFEVRVKIYDLNIRKGPGTSFEKNGICPAGVYNIIETKEAEGYTWGRLKSGAGWIALEHTQRV